MTDYKRQRTNTNSVPSERYNFTTTTRIRRIKLQHHLPHSSPRGRVVGAKATTPPGIGTLTLSSWGRVEGTEKTAREKEEERKKWRLSRGDADLMHDLEHPRRQSRHALRHKGEEVCVRLLVCEVQPEAILDLQQKDRPRPTDRSSDNKRAEAAARPQKRERDRDTCDQRRGGSAVHGVGLSG